MSSRREFGIDPSDKGKAVAEESGDNEDDWADDILLFEMVAPSTNRLVIPSELASATFPTLTDEQQVETLEITDTQGNKWPMQIQYYEEESGFILTGWQKFSTQYNVEPMDLIRFCEPCTQRHRLHFLIEVDKKGEGRIDPPEFRADNFLFQIELDQSNIDLYRVFLSRDDVRNFLGVNIETSSRLPNGVKVKKIMRFTDAEDKDWYMNITRYDDRRYMVMEGWGEFVKERGLEDGDLIRFYQHLHPDHSQHYLIGIVKKVGRGGPRQPRGGSGPGSSSRSYKGKEIAGGD